MRYAIVTDIHANWQSWDVTLKDIRKRGVDSILCLGDVVGYGPSPVRVLESTYENCDGFILGNHDAVIGNRLDSDLFNDHAKQIIEWTRQQMSEQAVDLFANMSLRMEGPGFECAHAELAVPGRFGYIYQAEDSLESFSSSQSPLMFVGHTHLPGYFQCDIRRGEVKKCDPIKFQVQEGFRYLVNAGSTGDPRDGTLKSSYVIYDAVKQTVDFCYVPFDVEAYKQEVQKAAIPARNYFLQVYSGQLEETETLRDMRISTEGMAKEVRKKSVKLNSNSFKRKNVNFRKVDSRRSAQRAASSKNLEEGSRRGVKPQNNFDKKQNLILIGAGSASALMVIILLVVYFMGGDDVEKVIAGHKPVEKEQQSTEEINEEEILKKAIQKVASKNLEKTPSQVFDEREIPEDTLLKDNRTWSLISDFDKEKAGWLIHSSNPRKAIYSSEEVPQEELDSSKFRSFYFLNTKDFGYSNSGPFRVYSPAFFLNKKYLHFQKSYSGQSINMLFLKDGSKEAESSLSYYADTNANATMDLSDFSKGRYRILIDGNSINEGDYLQIDSFGLSQKPKPKFVRRPLLGSTADGQKFIHNLTSGIPSEVLVNMDQMGREFAGVNVIELRKQVADLNVLYEVLTKYLNSKIDQRIDIRMAGMSKATTLTLAKGREENTFIINIAGLEYSFYPYELHPSFMFETYLKIENESLNLESKLKKYASMHEFLMSEDFPASRAYRIFNTDIYAKQLKLSSKQGIGAEVNCQIEIKSGNKLVFKGLDKDDLLIDLPYLIPVEKIEIDNLKTGKVISLNNNSQRVWDAAGSEDIFQPTPYNSYLMGQDLSNQVKSSELVFKDADILNVDEDVEGDKSFTFDFQGPTKADYLKLLFVSPLGPEDSKLHLKVRHRKEGNTQGSITFQGLLRPYLGLNYITLALPKDKLKAIDLEFETDDVITIRSIKFLRTK